MESQRIDWSNVTMMARSSPGLWRLHPDLTARSWHLKAHAARRVDAVQPDERGHFEFFRGPDAETELGKRVCDLWIRYVLDNEQEER